MLRRQSFIKLFQSRRRETWLIDGASVGMRPASTDSRHTEQLQRGRLPDLSVSEILKLTLADLRNYRPWQL